MKPLIIRTRNIEAFVAPDGEIELSKRGISGNDAVSGRGKGNLRELHHVWEMIQTWCKSNNISRLWCEPTQTDGRGKTRERVYSRVGFQKSGPVMVLNLKF
jgi:hypothetical protein